MKRFLIIYFAFTVLAIGVVAQVSNVDRVIIHADARTIASTGNSSVATLTLAPKTGYVPITCNDPDTCAVTLSETGMSDGQQLAIQNRSTNLVTFAPSVGVQELPCVVGLTQYQTLHFTYTVDRWASDWSLPCTVTVTLTNAQILALPTTPITIVPAPASGYRIKVLGATAQLDAAAGAYTTSAVYASMNLTCGGKWITLPLINDDSLTTDLTQLTGFLGSAQIRVWDLQLPYLDSVDSGSTTGTPGYVKYINNSSMPSKTNLNAQPVMLSGENTGGDYTGGNAANSLKVIVYFVKESVS